MANTNRPGCIASAQPKSKKRLVPLILALVMALLLAACSGGSGDDIKSPAGNGGSGTQNPPASAKITIAQTELYNANGITVTATELKSSIFGPEISLTISNNSDKNVIISDRELSVNGFMLSTSGLYCNVAAGKNAKESITLMSSELDRAGIETIADLEFYLHISDSDTYDDIATSELIKLSTSASADFVQPIDESGETVYNENDIRVICRGLKQDAIWDGTVVFYMENNSDRSVTIYAEDVSVNSFMVDVSLWAELRASTKIVDGMYILDLDELDISSIDGIESIEFSLRIVDGDSWSKIDTTDPITINFD